MKAAAAAFEIEERPPMIGETVLRVLLVDRAAAVPNATAAWLDRLPGIDLSAFRSAEEALTQSSGDRYDLCLLDHDLDGVDGVMLGAMIRALNPGARMVLMTQSFAPQLERRALEHGFQAVVPKGRVRQYLDAMLRR